MAGDAHEHAARAFTNLGSIAALTRRFTEAEQHLRAGIAYCAERDLDSWEHYMGATLARPLAERGRFDAANELASRLLSRPHLPEVVRIPATVAAAQVAPRRGENATALLVEASELATRTHEAAAIGARGGGPRRGGVAGGPRRRHPPEVDRAWQSAVAIRLPWDLGELTWWLAVAGLRPDRRARTRPFR